MVLLKRSSGGLSKPQAHAALLSQLVAVLVSLKFKVDLHKPSFQSTNFSIELILNNL